MEWAKRGLGRVIRAVFPIGSPLKLKEPSKPKVAPGVSLKPAIQSRFTREYIDGPKPLTKEERKRLPQWGLSEFAFEELQRRTKFGNNAEMWMPKTRWLELSASEREQLRSATELFDKHKNKHHLI